MDSDSALSMEVVSGEMSALTEEKDEAPSSDQQGKSSDKTVSVASE